MVRFFLDEFNGLSLYRLVSVWGVEKNDSNDLIILEGFKVKMGGQKKCPPMAVR